MSVDVVLPCLDQPRAPSGVLASLAAKHEYPAGRGQRFNRCVAGQHDRARRPGRAREAQWLPRRGAGPLNSPVDIVSRWSQQPRLRKPLGVGDDFGERLATARVEVSSALPTAPIVQIGMDTPQVTGAGLVQTAQVLPLPDDRHAAPDGGWWPLGVHDPRHAEVLRDVPTSHGDTGKRTLGALRIAGLRVALLHEPSDVDTMATTGEGANQALEARSADATTSVFAAEEAP